MSFQTIEEFYQLGLWDASQIAQLVQGGVLTPEQYQTITGQAYPVPVEKGPKPSEGQPVKEENKAGVAQG